MLTGIRENCILLYEVHPGEEDNPSLRSHTIVCGVITRLSEAFSIHQRRLRLSADQLIERFIRAGCGGLVGRP